MGDVLSFPGGDITHGGDPLLSGTRYIIAVFLLLEAGDGEKDGEGKGKGKGEGEEEGEVLLSGDTERSGQGVQGAVTTSAVEGGMSVVTREGEMGTMTKEGDGEGESRKYSAIQNGQHRHDKVEGKAPVNGSITAEQMLRFIGSYLSLYILDDTFSFSSLPTQPHLTANLAIPPENEKDPKRESSICNTVPEKKELFPFCFDSFE
jgi:hypothetical protein